ncbi:hypothetical protein MKK84_11355, partial [Methylobacterium sp. E-065]|uniref:hypothetical protein n=1 Tax=Methylobacterium sp. E-065 TaxID=2836583 RepID=UPI001FBA1BE2
MIQKLTIPIQMPASPILLESQSPKIGTLVLRTALTTAMPAANSKRVATISNHRGMSENVAP